MSRKTAKAYRGVFKRVLEIAHMAQQLAAKCFAIWMGLNLSRPPFFFDPLVSYENIRFDHFLFISDVFTSYFKKIWLRYLADDEKVLKYFRTIEAKYINYDEF